VPPHLPGLPVAAAVAFHPGRAAPSGGAAKDEGDVAKPALDGLDPLLPRPTAADGRRIPPVSPRPSLFPWPPPPSSRPSACVRGLEDEGDSENSFLPTPVPTGVLATNQTSPALLLCWPTPSCMIISLCIVQYSTYFLLPHPRSSHGTNKQSDKQRDIGRVPCAAAAAAARSRTGSTSPSLPLGVQLRHTASSPADSAVPVIRASLRPTPPFQAPYRPSSVSFLPDFCSREH
jgi:hypothetical protein